MGGTSYSVSSRSASGRTAAYASAPVNETFVQQDEKKAHVDMASQGVDIREARDSEVHPNSTPIQLYLDVTGSMLDIPEQLIKTGLPSLMSALIQNGVPDAALMFGAIGDHESDRFPLQVGQFESGDEELDHWLTRTYLEGWGGGNTGESYALAWYFAAYHTATDAWDKRQQKGYLFTIGDEPFLGNYPATAFNSIMGNTSRITQGSITAEELYTKACERHHVYHIFVEHRNRKVNDAWRQLMGENLIVVQDFTEIPSIVAKTVVEGCCGEQVVTTEGDVVDQTPQAPEEDGKPPKITL